eukprot:CAMPEP_0205879828 /NCGR_PEP_ID=MMETSP1083-20121108/15607_1 /ASSEMBLY_ACC=CAM_ASM_000430 /TAXON_ID=97485 /ORGANISM="Prymnesium parvum, Strain Texoma1" /LENGTH=45 /DNA_ID= /DNA_START= /DNA_END= /DNA_ORIENTATION=
MLAAVAWPLQEKLNPLLAAKWHIPNLGRICSLASQWALRHAGRSG